MYCTHYLFNIHSVEINLQEVIDFVIFLMYSTCRIEVSKVLKSMIVSSDKIWQSSETGLLHSRSCVVKIVLVTFHPVRNAIETIL